VDNTGGIELLQEAMDLKLYISFSATTIKVPLNNQTKPGLAIFETLQNQMWYLTTVQSRTRHNIV
jgi:hypothetical protein